MKKIILLIFLFGIFNAQTQSLIKAQYPIHNSTISDTSISIKWSLFTLQSGPYACRVIIATDSNFTNQVVNTYPVYGSQLAVVLENSKQYYYKIIAYGTYDTIYSRRINFVTMNVLAFKSLLINLNADNTVSSGGIITKVNDISSRGNHATQSNSPQRPTVVLNQLNGKPTIKFDGVNDFIQFTNVVDSIRSAFWIFKDNRIGPANYYRFLLGGATTYSFHRSGMNILFDNGTASVPVTKGAFRLNNTIMNGANTGLPSEICNLSLKTFNGFAVANNFSIDRGINGRVWDGDLYDLLIFNDTFTDDIYSKISNGLMDKYAPPIDLGDHKNTCASSLLINASKNSYRKWLWSNGDTNSTILVSSSGFYSVRVRDLFNRFSFDTIYVRFDTSNFAPNLGKDTSICFGQNSLLNAGPSHLSYLWSTGDTSNTLSINQTGNYIVSAKNCKNNTFKDTINLFVSNNKPNLPDTGIVCFNGTKILNPNLLDQSLKYLWNNGDTTKTRTINSGGVYILSVNDTFSCQFKDTITIYTDSLLKDISLGVDLNLCSGNSIGLLSNTYVKSYLWNTGSVLPKIQVNATTNYWVKATDSNFCSKNDTININIIGNAPNLSLTYSNICTNGFTKFKDLSIAPIGNTLVGQFWKFTSSDSSFAADDSFKFSNKGTKSIYHKVVTNVGCFSDTIFNIEIYNPPITNFSSGVSCAKTNSYFVNKTVFDIGDSAGSWFWNFGDGQNSTIKNAINKYDSKGKVNVSLTAISSKNCVLTKAIELEIFPPFIAVMGVDNTCQSDSTIFVDSTAGISTLYRMWNFGEGTSSFEKMAKHKYNSGGIYNVLLAIQNAIGCIDTIRKQVAIVSKPKSIITSGNGCYRDNYMFEEACTHGIGDSIVSYIWEVKGFDTFNVKNPIYPFRDTGNVSISLQVNTKFGCFDLSTKTIKIFPSPKAGFVMNSSLGEVPAKLVLTNLSLNANSYKWYFGKIDSSTLFSPSFVFNENGNYLIKLIATNSANCNDIYELPYTVKPTLLDLLVEKLIVKEIIGADSAVSYEMNVRLINVGTRPIYNIDFYINTLQQPAAIEHWKDTLMPGSNKTYLLNTRLSAGSSIFKNAICVYGKNVNGNQIEKNLENNKTCESVLNSIGINIYPNPAKDRIEIQAISPAEGTLKISLLDFKGKNILSLGEHACKKGLNVYKIDVSQIEKGQYYFRIENGGNSEIIKFQVGE